MGSNPKFQQAAREGQANEVSEYVLAELRRHVVSCEAEHADLRQQLAATSKAAEPEPLAAPAQAKEPLRRSFLARLKSRLGARNGNS